MPTPYESLVSFVEENGVSRYEAEDAIRRCVATMAKHGAYAYAAGGAVMYFMNVTPATALTYGSASLGLGAMHGLLKAPECRDIRQAVRNWTSAL